MTTTTNFETLLHDEYKRRDALYDDKFDPYNLADPIKPPPPPPSESLKQFQTRIEAAFPELPAPTEIRSRHPIVQTLIAYDKQIIAERKRGGWDTPNYQSEKGKLALDWLNLLLRHFEALGAKVTIRGRKYFRFEVTLLDRCREFVFFIHEKYVPPLRGKSNVRTNPPIYCFRWQHDANVPRKGYYEFDNMTSDCVKQIVMDLLLLKEQEYRNAIVANYEWNVERRRNAIERHQLEIELAARKKRRELEQLLKTREHLISTAISGMNDADRIRELVVAVQQKSANSKRPIRNVHRWVRWATHHANTIDIRYMSAAGLDDWITKFKLRQ